MSFRRRGAVRADQAERRLGRVGERPEQVEHRAHAERATHRRHFLHRRVVVRREQEGEARGGEALAGGTLVERQRQASTSSRSALPERLETERLPCFTTRTPAAATSSAAPVERLKLPDASPPVPTTSTAGGPGGSSGRRARPRIAPAKPRTSSG